MKCWVVGCHREAVHGGRCIRHKLPNYEDRPAKGTEYENTAMDLPTFGAAYVVEESIQDSTPDPTPVEEDKPEVEFGGGESGGGGAGGDF